MDDDMRGRALNFDYINAANMVQCGTCGFIFDIDDNHVCELSPIEANKRRAGKANCNYSVLCKEDKEQLDRIEAKLDKLLTTA